MPLNVNGRPRRRLSIILNHLISKLSTRPMFKPCQKISSRGNITISYNIHLPLLRSAFHMVMLLAVLSVISIVPCSALPFAWAARFTVTFLPSIKASVDKLSWLPLSLVDVIGTVEFSIVKVPVIF
jgi:hypothetical protein